MDRLFDGGGNALIACFDFEDAALTVDDVATGAPKTAVVVAPSLRVASHRRASGPAERPDIRHELSQLVVGDATYPWHPAIRDALADDVLQ